MQDDKEVRNRVPNGGMRSYCC